jgi:bifunctional non-homologous end joining protein LigD
LYGGGPDGITSFGMIQLASDAGNAAGLVFFLFDLLHLDGEDLGVRPLIESKAPLSGLLAPARTPLQYSDHQIDHGPAFHQQACAIKLEGIVSKRSDAAYAPGNRGLWLKIKCLHREEFVVIGWTDPEGSRPFLGAMLLGYYDSQGRLRGAVATGASGAIEEPRGHDSLARAGLGNTHFWIDRVNGVAGVILMQLIPFADAKALAVFDGFEKALYAALG